jgi:hypothetical protein
MVSTAFAVVKIKMAKRMNQRSFKRMQVTKQKLRELMVLSGFTGVEDDFEDDSILGSLLQKRVKAFNPNASPEELERIKKRCREELRLDRFRKAIAQVDEAQRRLEDTRAKQSTARLSRPGKRSSRYEAIDRELRTIAAAKPKSHREVFEQLDGRIRLPNAEPFVSARGWNAGFRKDPAGARAWLSKRWSALRLPAFPRGPK